MIKQQIYLKTFLIVIIALLSLSQAALQSVQFNLNRIPSQNPRSANRELIKQSLKLAQELLKNKIVKSQYHFDKILQLNGIEYKIDNYLDFQYIGTLLVGTSQQPIEFIFDTGSNQLWFPSSPCQGCAGDNLYKPENSSKYKKLSNTTQTIQYGKGKVYGYPSQDQIWFGDKAVDEMPCLTVYKEQDFEGTQADGILGLGPLQQQDQPPFLLDILRDSNIIDKRIISFKYRSYAQQNFLKNYKTKSRLIFGDPDMTLVLDGDSHIQLPLQSKGILYFVELRATEYHGQILGDKPQPALIDTGTSLIIAPMQEYQKLAIGLQKKYRSKIQFVQGMLAIFCSDIDSQDSMTFNLGGNKVTINSDKMWMEIDNYMQFSKTCILNISPSYYDFWILGDVFIRDFYVILNYEEGKVEMYGDFVKKFDDESRDKGSNDKLNPIYPDDDYRDSNNPIDDVDDNSDHENSQDYGIYRYIFIGIILGLILFICIFGCRSYCKKRRINKNLNHEQHSRERLMSRVRNY